MLVENLGSTLNAPKDVFLSLTSFSLCKALRKFNAVKSDSNSNEFRINYTEERREYKQLLKEKRAVHKLNIIKTLEKTRRMLESSGVRSNP